MLEEKIADKKPLYSATDASVESNRCLFCYDAPCVDACPTEINVPQFIRQIANNDVKGAATTILASNILGYSCARVCPVEVLCVGSCVLNHADEPPIQIGRLQRFAVEKAQQRYGFASLVPGKKSSTEKKVAVIGAGPASLSAAAMLVGLGHSVTVFEKNSHAGGLNALGIAPYKLHFADSQKEIDWLISLGVELKFNTKISAHASPGQFSAADLLDGFDALFFGVGLGSDSTLQIPNINNPRVFGATELIAQLKTSKTLDLEPVKTAHVIGGGNTAIDVAHELKCLGVQSVTMLYRKGEEAMSGYRHELDAARKSGVVFLGEQQLKEISLSEDGSMQLWLSQGANKTIYKTDSDMLVLAIGQKQLLDLARALSVSLDESGCVIADSKNGRTSNPIVWSGGDCTNGGKEVVNAVQDGKNAALNIDEYLKTTGGRNV